MKRLILLAVIFIAGCTSQQSDQLTRQQKEQIISEVKTVCDSLWAKWSRLDGEATVQHFWDSPEFTAFNADGSRSDYQVYKNMTLAGAAAVASFKLSPARTDFHVLSKDAVIYAMFGKSELAVKSGEKITYDPDAITFVFSKLSGQWKIVHVQESSTIVTQKAGKK